MFKLVIWRHYSLYAQWSCFRFFWIPKTYRVEWRDSFSGKPSLTILILQGIFTGITLSAPDDKIRRYLWPQVEKKNPYVSVWKILSVDSGEQDYAARRSLFSVYAFFAPVKVLSQLLRYEISHNLTSHTSAAQFTHHQLLDQRFSFGDHLSELCYEMQVFWSAFSVPQLLLGPLQPGHMDGCISKVGR